MSRVAILILMEPAVTGQTIEWLVWSAITARSGGALHCYLPLRDLGVDAMVRHRASGTSVAVQVKGRTRLEEKILRIHVQTEEADVPGAVLVAVVVDEQALTIAEPLFVVPMADLKRLATVVPYGPRHAYSFEVPYPPLGASHWQPFACSLEQVAQRLLPVGAYAEELEESGESRFGATGYLGEMSLLRHLAASDVLSVFHAAPDTEFVEYLVLRIDTGKYAGVQVKCVEVDDAGAGMIHVPQRTFSPGAGDMMVVFMRVGDVASDAALHPLCFVIPAADIAGLASSHDGRFDINVNPSVAGRLGKYRLAVTELRGRMEELLG
jgi:hypothetical protein